MSNLIRKLTSRKLWMAIAGVATGIAMAFGVDASDISVVSGAVLAVVSCVTFIVTEGRVDAEAVKNAVQGVQDAVDTIQKDGDPDASEQGH